jgi:pyruvate kinase
MLSGETAVGDHPVVVVETMDRIVRTTEERRAELKEAGVKGLAPQSYGARVAGVDTWCQSPLGPTVAEAISRAAHYLAAELSAAAVITPTQTGATARQVARFRPSVPIAAVTTSPVVQRQLCLAFGVHPLLTCEAEDTDGTIGVAVEAAREAGLVSEGDAVVITCGARVNTPESTNLIKVERVGA